MLRTEYLRILQRCPVLYCILRKIDEKNSRRHWVDAVIRTTVIGAITCLLPYRSNEILRFNTLDLSPSGYFGASNGKRRQGIWINEKRQN